MKKPPLKNKNPFFAISSTGKMPMDIEIKKERSILSIDENDLKEIKNWNVGKKYRLVIDVEMTCLKKQEYGDKSMCGEFRINKIKSE